MTQRDRVLTLLTRAGERGLTSYDLAARLPEDGGPRIMRLPARINELIAQGYPILTMPERRDGHTVYVLRETLPNTPPETEEAEVLGSILELFPAPERKTRSPYDLDAA